MQKLYESAKQKLIIGNKYTIWKFGDMGFPYKIQCKLLAIHQRKYAQYENALFFDYVEKRKKHTTRIMICRIEEPLIIWDGWQDVKSDMFVSKSADGMCSNSLLCFSHGYIDRALSSTDKKPIIFQDYFIIPEEREKEENVNQL